MSGFDSKGAERQPIFNAPGIVLALVASFLALHAWRESMTLEASFRMLSDFAFVPGRFTFAINPDELLRRIQDALADMSPAEAAASRYLLGDGGAKPWTLVTYAFLHGNWSHALLNSMWLMVFGSAVARRFGAPRFLGLMVVSAIGAALVHYVTHRFDLTPIVGASGAVSGAMGAAVRFVFQPGAPLGPTLAFGRDSDAYAQSAPPLRVVMSDRRVFGFVAAWFVLNFVFGANAVALGASDSPVAWEAHVGGFLVGLVLFPFFDPRRRS